MTSAAQYSHAHCTVCKKHSYCMPLHGDNGGPLCCLTCVGKWHAEHGQRRRLGRIVIRALTAYFAAGGDSRDVEKLKISACGRALGVSDLGDMFDPLGYLADTAATAGENVELTSELLVDALRLTHPDHHPPERQDLAHRVTQQLLSLQPFVFPAPKPPKPVTPPSAPPIKDREVTSKTPRFPCKDCAATVPAYYCAACSAEWNKRQQGKHSRECAKRRAQYQRRKQRLALTRSPKQCTECGRKLNGKRFARIAVVSGRTAKPLRLIQRTRLTTK